MEYIYSIRADEARKECVATIVSKEFWDRNSCLSGVHGNRLQELMPEDILIEEIRESEYLLFEDDGEKSLSLEELMAATVEELEKIPDAEPLGVDSIEKIFESIDELTYSEELAEFVAEHLPC